ncbi:DYW_deaminase domain-containing protein [Psidium guajava]|nr:DYW_deaminase domain-containing protein [Psidium guajava]
MLLILWILLTVTRTRAFPDEGITRQSNLVGSLLRQIAFAKQSRKITGERSN